MKPNSSLDWEWMDWRDWAAGLLETHSHDQVADSIADLGLQVNDLRRGMVAEAIVVNAQTLSLSPRALGKGRREIVRQQVRRMFRCGLALEPPRSLVRRCCSWSRGANEELTRFEEDA